MKIIQTNCIADKSGVVVICTSDSGRKLYGIEEYPDYEYIVGYYAWDGVIYKKDETD